MISQFIPRILDILFPSPPQYKKVEALSLSKLLEIAAQYHDDTPGIQIFLPYRENIVRDMIWLLKYRNNAHARELSADLFLEKMSEDLSEKMLMRGGKKLLLVPIPMSKGRLNERGYNQTETLAHSIIERGGGEYLQLETSLLARNREAPTQTSIRDRRKRINNVTGIFTVMKPEEISGKSIVLLDDVTTTGATLAEAKRALRESGAHEVLCVAITH